MNLYFFSFTYLLFTHVDISLVGIRRPGVGTRRPGVDYIDFSYYYYIYIIKRVHFFPGTTFYYYGHSINNITIIKCD